MSKFIYDAFFTVCIEAFTIEDYVSFYSKRNDVIYLDYPPEVKNREVSKDWDWTIDPVIVPEMWDWCIEPTVCRCPQCLSDKVERHKLGSADRISGAMIVGDMLPQYIVLSSWCDALFVTQKFVSLLEKENFSGYRLHVVERGENTELVGSPLFKKSCPEIYGLFYEGTLYSPYKNTKSPTVKCVTCGYDKILCLGEALAHVCPKCKKNDYDYSNYFIRNPAADAIFSPKIDVFAGGIDMNFSQPVYGDKWDGSDFLSGNFLVSGRVVKWFVRNQIYPMCFVPYPCYVSGCTKEQREAIEKIRFHHPCAIKPIMPTEP